MFYEPGKDRKQVLDEMLATGVTLQDLKTLKRGEEQYLWGKDVATVSQLSEFTEENLRKIYRICKKKDSVSIKHKSSLTERKKFRRVKYHVDYIIPLEAYAKFVQWRELNKSSAVSKRAGYGILGRRTVDNLIKGGKLRLLSITVKGKKATGISKKSLLEQIYNKINALKKMADKIKYV